MDGWRKGDKGKKGSGSWRTTASLGAALNLNADVVGHRRLPFAHYESVRRISPAVAGFNLANLPLVDSTSSE